MYVMVAMVVRVAAMLNVMVVAMVVVGLLRRWNNQF